MTTHVHRDGPQITVHDDNGREVALLSQGHTLHIRTRGETPQLTPQMAHDLAEQLHQWAATQQTVRRTTGRSTH